jgi:hypothetical protein
VLISKAMSLLGQQIEDILRLFDKSWPPRTLISLASSTMYKQTNLFIEDIKKMVVNWAIHKPPPRV